MLSSVKHRPFKEERSHLKNSLPIPPSVRCSRWIQLQQNQ